MAEEREILIVTKEKGTQKTDKAQKDLAKSVGETNKEIDEQGESLIDTAKDAKFFGVSFNSLTSGFRNSVGAIKGSVTALKSFRIALALTGIGAIVIALGSLIAMFKGSQEGTDKLNRVMNVIKFTIDALIKSAVSLGKAIFKIITGDVINGFKELKSAISGVGDEIRRNLILSGEFSERQIIIEKQAINLVLQQAAYNKVIAESREILADTQKTEEQRIAAGERALKAAEDLAKVEAFNLQTRIEQLQVGLEASETFREDELEIATLQAEQITAETTLARTRLRIITQLNTLRKQATTEEQDAIRETATLKQQAFDLEVEQQGFLLDFKKRGIAATKESAEAEMSLGDTVQALGSQLGQFGKAGAIAQAIINVAQGITKAFALGGPAGFATGAAVASAGAVQIAKIKATKIPGGGGTGGGSSPSVSGFPSIAPQSDNSGAILSAIQGIPNAVLVLDDLTKAQTNQSIQVRNASI